MYQLSAVMCILFVYINNDSTADGYQVVIANNREEFYDRPTKPAEKWGVNNSLIAGNNTRSISIDTY